MEKLIYANGILFAIVGSLCVGIGLDLRKWQSWLLVFYGFISGFLIGFIKNDGNSGFKVGVNFDTSLQAGFLFSGMVMCGAVIRSNKNLAEKLLENISETKSIFGVTIPPALLSRIQTQHLQVSENSKQSQLPAKSPKKKMSRNHNKTKKDSHFVSGKK